MADGSLSDVGFWLPSEFLTDEDILMDKENFNKNGPVTGFGLFGYSPFLRSPIESLTESDDEDEFLTGLTRQFARSSLQGTHKIPFAPPRNPEKTWGFSGSPQSTLTPVSSNGRIPNGVSQGLSPLTALFGGNDDAWDLIFEAAGQVSRGTRNITPINFPTPTAGLYSADQVKKQCGSIWGNQQLYQNGGSRVCGGNGGCARASGLPESPWPALQIQKQRFYQNQQQSGGGVGMGRIFLGAGSGVGVGGGGVKRECAGTGVFLPRRYTAAPDSRKKSGCSTASLPPRVVQNLNKNFDNMNPQAQPHFNGVLVPDYDVLIARRNALLAAQQRRNINTTRAERAMNNEIRLPQEWTY